MTVVTVDNTDLAAVMADAGMEPTPEAEKPADKPAEKTEAKTEPKDAKVEAKTDADPEDDPDDAEDENGTTERQRKELSAKMLKAIGKKHRQVKEAEEFAAHQVREKQAAEARAAELERKLREMQPVKEPAKEPQRQDFQTDDEYIEARADWKADQKLAEREEQRHQAELNAGVERRFKTAMETVPDFRSVIEANPLAFPEAMRAYVRESEMSAEICYHFAKDAQAFAKVVAMNPVRQLVELGKIEAKLAPFGSSQGSSKEASDKPADGKADKAAPSTQDTGFSLSKARSDAPVIKPLSASDGTQVEVSPEKMTTRQMIEDYQRTMKVNLHARKRH